MFPWHLRYGLPKAKRHSTRGPPLPAVYPPPCLQAAPSLTEQYEYAQSRGIPWLVIINASTFGGARVGWKGEGRNGVARLGWSGWQAAHFVEARVPCSAPPNPAAASPRPAAADTVRVKAMNARLEEDVSASDLATYLLNALHPHGSGAPAGSRTPHPAGRAGDEADAAGEGEEPSAHGYRERQRRGGRR